MPLYECAKCHAVDNTALTNYWWTVDIEHRPALCSECDPEIGKWHGKFEKISAAEFRKRFPGEKIDYPITPPTLGKH